MRCFTKRKINVVCLFCAFASGGLVLSSGCLLYLSLASGDCWSQLTIEGRVVDAVTFEPATDVFLGIRAERDGEVIRFSNPTTDSGEPTNPLPEADGGFSFFIDSLGVTCPVSVSVPEPDLVTLLVVRGACTEEIVLDISDESVVRAIEDTGGFRTDIFTLLNPVLVAECQQP